MSKDEKYPLALPKGTVLAGQYVIEKVLGQGGFGITYKATDYKNNNNPVAIKEYFPDTLVYREMTTVISYPGERTENFDYGKQSFLDEAETLAKFLGNDNIVRVYSYFEENGTAYFAMEYVDGIPFDKYLTQKGGRIGIEEAKSILIPVMDALGAVHSAGIIHRDVTPDNIYLSNDGRVMLLDFGAARYSLGDKSRSLDVVLKHGFAPKEQYSRRGKQGPYTDVYALGATFYFALTGKRPPESIERMDEDDLIPPHNLGINITEYQEEAILKALKVQPSERFQTMAEFKSVLLNENKGSVGGASNVINFSSPVPQPTQQQPQQPPQYPPQQPQWNNMPPMPQQGYPNQMQQNMPQQGGDSVNELKNALINTGAATKKALALAAENVKNKVALQKQKKSNPAQPPFMPPQGMGQPMYNNSPVPQPNIPQSSLPQSNLPTSNIPQSNISQAAGAVDTNVQQPKKLTLEKNNNVSESQNDNMPMRTVAPQQMGSTSSTSSSATNNTQNGSFNAPNIPVAPIQPVNNGVQPQNPPVYQTPGKPKKKGLIIGAAAACVVVGLTVAIVAGNSSSKTKSVSHTGNASSVTVSNVNDNDGTSSTVYSSPVIDTDYFSSSYSSYTTSSKASTQYSKQDLEIIGNTPANIKNFGYYTSDGTNKFWSDEDGHALMSNLSGKKYLYQNQTGIFNCLSYAENTLFFIYDGQAYSMNPSSDSEAQLITSLKSYSDITNMYVSSAFFFIYQEDTLYRINRSTGTMEQSMSIDFADDFTFYDGWLYYIGEDTDGDSAIFRVSESDFEDYSDYYLHRDNGYYSSPVIVDGLLYALIVTDEETGILNASPKLDGSNIKTWNITTYTGTDYTCNLNVIGKNTFFTVYKEDDDKYDLYRFVKSSDNTYTCSTITDLSAMYPSITLQDGDYKVNYMAYDGEKDMFINRYIIYDHTTNNKKDN